MSLVKKNAILEVLGKKHLRWTVVNFFPQSVLLEFAPRFLKQIDWRPSAAWRFRRLEEKLLKMSRTLRTISNNDKKVTLPITRKQSHSLVPFRQAEHTKLEKRGSISNLSWTVSTGFALSTIHSPTYFCAKCSGLYSKWAEDWNTVVIEKCTASVGKVLRKYFAPYFNDHFQKTYIFPAFNAISCRRKISVFQNNRLSSHACTLVLRWTPAIFYRKHWKDQAMRWSSEG